MSVPSNPARRDIPGAGLDPEAESAAQRNMVLVADAVLSEDFNAFLEHVRLPLVTATSKGLQRFETREAMEGAFRQVAAEWRDLGVTRVEGTIGAVIPYGPGRVMRTHVTRLFKRATLARPPHSGLSRLTREDGHWRLSRSHYAIGDGPFGKDFETMPGADEDHAEVAAIFSDALDRMTRAFLQGDFALLSDSVRLPLFLQNADGTLVIRDREALRADYDRVMTDFRMHEVTDLVRLVKRARRLCTRRIQGLYRTHVLTGQLLALPSFQSVMTLEQGGDGVWRTAEIMHPLGPVTLRR
ncbi:hypothetical protein [Citreimonas sp.]|uniref:hypothetical protein n=1 Tax=Citreimonas sp. TaxID=3036715 RepID=UPI0040593516